MPATGFSCQPWSSPVRQNRMRGNRSINCVKTARRSQITDRSYGNVGRQSSSGHKQANKWGKLRQTAEARILCQQLFGASLLNTVSVTYTPAVPLIVNCEFGSRVGGGNKVSSCFKYLFICCVYLFFVNLTKCARQCITNNFRLAEHPERSAQY